MNLIPASEYFYPQLSQWETLNLEQRKQLKEEYLSYEVSYRMSDVFIGGVIGLLLHEGSREGISRMKSVAALQRYFSRKSQIASFAIGGASVYYLVPMLEKYILGIYFDQSYPME